MGFEICQSNLGSQRSSSRHVFTNFQNMNLRIISTKCYEIFVMNCSKMRKKNAFFDQQGICFLFELRNIGEKIRKFVFGKFVKTCRELDKRPFDGSTNSILRQ